MEPSISAVLRTNEDIVDVLRYIGELEVKENNNTYFLNGSWYQVMYIEQCLMVETRRLCELINVCL